MSTAVAEDTSNVGPLLTEVTVTAERRPDNAQALPVSVAALTRDDLASRVVLESGDLGAAVPGLQFDRQGLGAAPFIRGVGSTSAAVGNESPVAVYLDGVYVASANAALFSVAHVSQVDVLRGPQGTLFGRNATGGVIQFTTPDPVRDPAAELGVGYGGFGTRGASVYATGGNDRLAVNFMGQWRDQRDGWGRNRTTGDPTFRERENGEHAKLRWTPTPRTTVAVTARAVERRSEQGLGYHLVPGSLALDGRSTYAGFYDTLASPEDRGRYRGELVSIRAEHDFAWFRTVDILAWQRMRGEFQLDQDMGPLPIIEAPIVQRQHATTNELQVMSLPESPTRWIVGLYTLADVSAYAPLALRGLAVAPLSMLEIASTQRTRSYAAYAQLTTPLSSTTRLTLGARQTQDRREVRGTTTGYFTGVAAPVASARQQARWTRPTWRVALDHDVAEHVLAYASWDRGFKSGVYNLLSYAAPAVDPETLDALQVGLKSEWLQRRLRVNVSAFSYRYRNIQVDQIVSGATFLVNAAAARMNGADVDVDFAPSAAWTQYVRVALLDGRYTSFPNAPASAPAVGPAGVPVGGNVMFSRDVSGLTTVRSPRLTAGAGVRWTTRAPGGRAGIDVSGYYNAGFAWDPDHRLRQAPYGLVGASLFWESSDGTLSLRASGANLTNAKVCVFAAATAPGDLCSPRAPRTLLVDVSIRR